ncbi:MAG: hexose kinase [Candidatus Saccharimonas sp.]|nr:hexose kinase [Planctomycetaceae bacterium]
MIVAAGLTPAWQQILLFDRLRIGHVNRAQTVVWCGSGKVLNVGAVLHQLGAKSLTLCPVGGSTGQQIRDNFAERGIPARWLSTSAATRVCTTILDEETGQTTELVENSAPLSEAELDAYADAFTEEAHAASVVVLSGSLPQGAPANYYRRLLERTPAKAILDVRGRELIESLPLRPFLVKPNREELAATVGRPLATDDDVSVAMSELRTLGAEWVVVSDGPAPLMALGPDGMHRIEPPRVKVINPIGCGDALCAELALQIDRQRPVVDAIREAVANASKRASELLP